MLRDIHSQFWFICLTVLSQPLFKLSRTAQEQGLCMSCPTSTQPLPLEVLILSSCFNETACFQLNELGLSQLWTAVYHRCAFNAIHFCSKQQAVIIQLCPEHHTQLFLFIHRFCHIRYSIWFVLKKKEMNFSPTEPHTYNKVIHLIFTVPPNVYQFFFDVIHFMQWDTVLHTKPTIYTFITYAMTHCSLLHVSPADHCLYHHTDIQNLIKVIHL